MAKTPDTEARESKLKINLLSFKEARGLVEFGKTKSKINRYLYLSKHY
jgi:hypothetical protein